MSTIPINPYIGPRTFQKNEGHLFYGREREARDLVALVASERLVVFYAQSGAGKSSIVNTRLIPNLEAKDYEVLPVGRVAGDSAESIDIENIYVYNLLRSLEQHETVPTVFSKLSLSNFLAHLNMDENGFFYDSKPLEAIQEGDNVEVVRRALVIDQFEELFSTHPEAWEKRDDFFQQLAKAMEDDPYLWVVLVMREDYIAALDPYAHYVENGLRVRYYMQRLEREAALKAVTSPVEELRPFAKGVAEKLIDDLCSIAVLKPDGTPDVQPGQYVEPVQLQVVCYGLWNNLSPDGKQITEKDLEDVGDVGQSLGKHYDGRVSEVAKAKKVKERLIREWFEKKLITAGGIRNMVLQEHEPKPGELDDDVIQALQSDLVRGEKRGGATWYELTHDRLVDPILQSNEIWFEEHLSPLQRQAALWKEQNRQESWLLSGHALVEVEVWAGTHQDELTDTENEFLDACRNLQIQVKAKEDADRQQLEMANKLAAEQARSVKRARLFNIVSGILIVIAIIATISSSKSAHEAEQAKKEAQKLAVDAKLAEQNALKQSNIARSSELSTIALDKAAGQLDLAILLGLEADSLNLDSSQTEKTLLTLLQKSGRYRGSIKEADDIQQILYSPDGKTFASRDQNGITFWDANSLEPINAASPINGHSSGIVTLTLSNDGKIMASGATDGSIVIWDVDEMQPLSAPIKTQNGAVSSLAFSVDGTILASASWDDVTILLWDMTDPTKPKKIGTPLSEHTSGIFSLAFSPNGKILVSGGYDSTIIMWDVETHKPIVDPIIEHQDWVNDFAFNNDGTILASASDDNRVVLWDVENPSKFKILSADVANEEYTFIHSVSISPDDQILAFGNVDGLITLWDISNPKQPIRFGEPFNLGAGTDIIRLEFSPSGDVLASSSYDGAFVLWDVKDPDKPKKLSEPAKGQFNYGYDFVFSPDGNTLISTSSDGGIAYWDVTDLQNPILVGESPTIHSGQPTGMEFIGNGELLISYGDDGGLLIDVGNQELHGAGDLSTSLNGELLVYQILDKVTGGNAIHLIDVTTGDKIGDTLTGQDPSFSPDGTKLIFQTYDDNGEIISQLWDVETDQELLSFDYGYTSFSPDGQILVNEITDDTTGQHFLNVWDISSTTNIAKDIPGSYLAVSSDNRILVHQTEDPETGITFLNLWDIDTNRNIRKEIEGYYRTISPNNKYLVYETYNYDSGETLINIWDINAAKSIKTVPGNIYAVSEDGVLISYVTYKSDNNAVINILNTNTDPFIEETFDTQSETVNDMFFSQNSAILIFQNSDEKGNYQYNFLDTLTVELIGDPAIGYINIFQDLGQVLISEFYNYNNGETNIVLINTSTGEYAGPIKGSYMDLIMDGRTLIYQVLENNNYFVNLWDIDNNRNIGEPFEGRYEAISSDGRTLVTRSDNNSLVFWDVSKTWPLGEPIDIETQEASSAILSADGQILAWVGTDGITLQNVISAKITANLSNDHVGSDFPGANPNFSPDGSILAIVNYDTSVTQLWDMSTQEQIGDDYSGQYASFSPDGSILAIGNWNTSTITLWDVNTLEQIGDGLPGIYASFSPDGKTIANSDTSTITLWDVNTLEQIGDELLGDNPSFSPDGSILAIGNWNTSTITLWDLNTLEQIGDELPGVFASFSPDGGILAIGNYDTSSTQLWDMKTLEQIGDEFPGVFATFSPDGRILAIGNDNNSTTTLWNVNALEQFGDRLLGEHPSFSPDGTMLAIGRWNSSTTTFWDMTLLDQIGDDYSGDYASFSPDGKTIAIGNYNTSTTMLWNMSENKLLVQPEKGRTIPVTSLVFSQNGKILASLASDGIILSNLETGEPLRLDSKDYAGQITDRMSFYDNDTHFIALGEDGTLLTWDVVTGRYTIPDDIDQPLIGGGGGISAFSPDGIYLVYESDERLKIWNVLESKPFSGADVFPDITNSVGAISFNPAGTMLAYSDGGTITIYNFPALNKLGELSVGSNMIIDINFIMDNSSIRYLVTLDDSGDTQIWDWANRTKVGKPMSGYLQFVGSNNQSHIVVYIDSSGRLIKFKIDLDHTEWQNVLCPLVARNFSKEEWKLYFPDQDYPTKDLLTCPDFGPGE